MLLSVSNQQITNGITYEKFMALLCVEGESETS